MSLISKDKYKCEICGSYFNCDCIQKDGHKLDRQIQFSFTEPDIKLTKKVLGFFDDYRWLSNFYFCDVYFEGLIYPSAENAYQSAKTNDLELRKTFINMTPNESKKAGQIIELRKDWEHIKLNIMKTIVKDKFTRNVDLREKLLDTNDMYLEEANWWKDEFYGTYNGIGQNHLGKILMEVREELK